MRVQGKILVGFGRRYAQPGRCTADAALNDDFFHLK